VIHSIRWRIGVSVFIVVATLHVVFSLLVLRHVERTLGDEIDDELLEELAQVIGLLGTRDLQDLVRAEEAQNNKWSELFFEVRDADGRVVVASDNVPSAGFGEASKREPLRWRHRRGPMPAVHVWDRVHPASRKRHTRLRVAETATNGFEIRVAHTLKRSQKTYWRLREQLAWSLLAVALVGAAGAWWVARRSLAPIQAITQQARRLGGSSEGALPRTGSGDELDRLAEVLNQMLERLRVEMRRVRRMSADAAHALRTPLAGMRGTIELHLRKLPKEQAEDLLPALESLDETVQFVNRLLLLERLEGAEPDRRSWCDLRIDSLAHQIVDAMGIVAHDRGIDLKCEGEPLTVYGDPTQLRHAILGLVDNALRHTPAGGRVTVSVHKLGELAAVTVQDTGPGLRPEQLERVFERFYSEREDGVVGGLGLPIARAIAQVHGGALGVTSEAGARFEVRLPLSSLRVLG
jgi:signal transduction histidine kinase